jgi:BlaI family penicillinase repressor
VVILKQKISTAEWKVMEVLWEGKELLASEVAQALEDTGWSDRTVRTLLSRLVKKGVADYRVEGRSYIYYAVISKDECIKNENLTRDEIKELRELLDKKGERDG